MLVLGAKFLRGKSMKKILMFGLLAALAASFVVFFIIRNNMFAAIVFNRLLFLPAKIKFAYFDFFSTNEYIYFSQSSIASILGIPSNYPINVMYLIGGEYFNDSGMWTNTGFLADAY